MSNYTFTFKKDDITVEFTTTDKYIVERQFQLWVNSASEYTQQQKALTGEEKKNLKFEPVKNEQKLAAEVQQIEPAPQVQATVEAVGPKVEPAKNEPEQVEPVKTAPEFVQDVQPAVEPVREAVEEIPAQAPINEEVVEHSPYEIPLVDSNIHESAPEVQSVSVVESEMVEEAPAGAQEVFDKASSLLKTINSIQNPEESVVEIKEEKVDFEKVLEKTIENPTFEPNKVKDASFLSLITSKNTTDKFHYLIITAYYLLEYEKMARFSLKQINAKLMQNLSEIVDHSVLQSAIEQQLIDIVPDLTGVSDIAEYKLTELGEDFFINRI